MKHPFKQQIELSRTQFFILLQSIFIGIVLLYQLMWFCFGKNVYAECFVYGRLNELENSGTIMYKYVVNNHTYEDYGTRNEISTATKSINIRYLSFAPSIARINTFYAHWIGFIIAYFIFFTFTTLLFFIPNDTMPARSYFYFTKKKPWVNIIEK